MTSLQYKMDSPVGPIYLLANASFLQGVYWKKSSVPFVGSLSSSDPAVQVLAETEKQLREYFAGKRREFELPLDAKGTDFQMRVWQELSRIPYGKTCSYSDIASKIKNDKAVRAVGTANGRNPLSIVVPCHRVIQANGTLGGYAGGLLVKTKLLQIEAVNGSTK